jgi:phenylacetate-CoA ligase
MSHASSAALAGRDAIAHRLGQSLARTWRQDATQRRALDGRQLAKVLRSAARLDGYRGRLPATTTSTTRDCWKIYADLALLTKAEVRGREKEFSSRHGLTAATSGTTGTPLRLLRSPASILMEEAWVSHCRRWAGYRPGQPTAVLRGATFPSDEAVVPHHLTALTGHLIMSSYHLNESTAAEYLNLLRRHKTRWIAAYPSSIASLTILSQRCGLEIPQMSGIFTSSETLTTQVRTAIESAWGCKVWDYYGNAERTVAAAQCEVGRYHLLPGYAVVEPIPSGLATTSLLNRAMPLVKYEVTDNLEDWNQNLCTCARIGPTIAGVTGRSEDIIFGADNRRIGRLDPVFKGVTGVLAGQFIQEEPGKVTVRVLPSLETPPADLQDDLRRRVIERTGPINVCVQMCSALELLPNGKAPFVIQRLGGERG